MPYRSRSELERRREPFTSSPREQNDLSQSIPGLGGSRKNGTQDKG